MGNLLEVDLQKSTGRVLKTLEFCEWNVFILIIFNKRTNEMHQRDQRMVIFPYYIKQIVQVPDIQLLSIKQAYEFRFCLERQLRHTTP